MKKHFLLHAFEYVMKTCFLMESDFANDVLGVYKKPINKLCSPFSINFENETSVGSEVVREFFSILVNMIIDGFPLNGENKPVTLVFESEDDHSSSCKLPPATYRFL